MRVRWCTLRQYRGSRLSFLFQTAKFVSPPGKFGHLSQMQGISLGTGLTTTIPCCTGAATILA